MPPGPISASYVVPGSGTLKETHIFTPSKAAVLNGPTATVKENRGQSNPSSELEKPATGSIIDESVVKKEYRDVVYDPERLKTSTKADDEFSDFQSVPALEATAPVVGLPLSNIILEPIKAPGSIVINWPDPGQIVDSTNIEDFTYASISQTVPTAPETVKPVDSIPDPTEPVRSNETSLTREYNKPVIGVSPSDYMFSAPIQTVPPNDFDDEFTEFQSTSVPVGTATVPQIPDVLLHAQKPSVLTAKFILPLPDVSQSAPSTVKPNKLNEELPWQQITDNNYAVPAAPPQLAHTTPTPVLPAALLVPLPSSGCLVPEVTPSNSIVSGVRIEWPDPGIDPDEMARIDALFPQPKTVAATNNQSITAPNPSPTKNANRSAADADDEWTDFVSVSQPQLPITNILSQSLQKQQNDDDDWSDFVSSTGPVQSQQPWTNATGPNFPAWNAPQSSPFGGAGIFQSSGHQVSIPAPSSLINTIEFPPAPNASHHNGFNNVNHKNKSNGKIPLRPLQNHSTASIISLPDLGFSGPKTLVNMPKSNFSKK